MPKLLSALLLSLSLTMTACTGTGAYSSSSQSDRQEREASRVMHLYRIDIDHEAVRNGARLLFEEPPPRREQGYQRRSKGFFSVSDARYCRIEVGCVEPVVGLNGQRTQLGYTMLRFFGRIAEDGNRATTTAGERNTLNSARVIDEVRFIERGEDKITIQAWDNGKPGAYLFHFNRAPIGRSDVMVPWR